MGDALEAHRHNLFGIPANSTSEKLGLNAFMRCSRNPGHLRSDGSDVITPRHGLPAPVGLAEALRVQAIDSARYRAKSLDAGVIVHVSTTDWTAHAQSMQVSNTVGTEDVYLGLF